MDPNGLEMMTQLKNERGKEKNAKNTKSDSPTES
jgi:hypothetical protein